MKPWSVKIQLNGEETSDFYDIGFEVPEKLYAKMQTAIKKGTPLAKCSFYKELKKRAYDAAEDEINWELRDSAYGDKPERGDYDCKEDYENELEAYYCSDSIDNYCMVEFDIYDPCYEASFKKKFVGITCPDMATGEVYAAYFEYEEIDEICANYSVKVHFDENGTITDITDITGEAMESEDVKGSSWGDCEPNYDLIESGLREDLGLDEDKE